MNARTRPPRLFIYGMMVERAASPLLHVRPASNTSQLPRLVRNRIASPWPTSSTCISTPPPYGSGIPGAQVTTQRHAPPATTALAGYRVVVATANETTANAPATTVTIPGTTATEPPGTAAATLA